MYINVYQVSAYRLNFNGILVVIGRALVLSKPPTKPLADLHSLSSH